MKFYAQINHNGKVVPEFDSDYDTFKKLKRDTTLLFEIRQERNAKFHRKFFALIKMVFDNQEIFQSVEDLRYELTIEAGYFEEYVTFGGEVKRKAKSISFASMEQKDFEQLYNMFVHTVIRGFKYSNAEIEENLESYL